MGNLFGSEQPRHQPSFEYGYGGNSTNYCNTSVEQRRRQILEEQRRKQILDQQQSIIRQQHQEQLHARLAAQRLAEHRELIRQQKEKLTISTVTPNSNLIKSLLRCPETNNWAPCDYTHATVRFVNLAKSSSEYQRINNMFVRTNKKFFEVTSIERIQNPYLMAGFLLKMEEMERLGYNPQVMELFHGTKRCFVDSIANKNFDWRKHGENRGYKFGKGVSFTPISNYATHYGDKDLENNVMFLVKVLVGNSCIGHEYMILPAADCDTSEKPDGHVVVKYEDNDFYPAYKITYLCSVNPEIANKKRNNFNFN